MPASNQNNDCYICVQNSYDNYNLSIILFLNVLKVYSGGTLSKILLIFQYHVFTKIFGSINVTFSYAFKWSHDLIWVTIPYLHLLTLHFFIHFRVWGFLIISYLRYYKVSQFPAPLSILLLCNTNVVLIMSKPLTQKF